MSTSVTTASGVLRPQRALNFDRLARAYRWMEWLSFGPYLWRCRSAFLADMAQARRALVLGDGDGRFVSALLRRNRSVRIDAVDVSPGMLRSLLRRAGCDAARVSTEIRDVRDWIPAPAAEYDLVVTHFLLDCLTTAEVRALADRVAVTLAPGARWVVSEFAVPGGAFGRWVAGPVVAFLYLAFGLLTGLPVRRLPDHGTALRGAGFRIAQHRRLLRGLLVCQAWTLEKPT